MNRLFAALIGLVLVTPAFADSTINNLGAGSAVTGTDILPAYQGANPATGVTASQLKTFANTSAVRATTTTSEAILNSDQNKLVTFSNGSAVACTIAQAGGGGNFGAGWAVSLKNLGAGTVTCTPATSTVDGSATFTLTTGQGLDLYSDGTNYFTQGGKGSSSTGANPSATGSDVAVNGSASTFMRSDGAPAIQKGTNAQFGLAEGDGSTISLAAGVASIVTFSPKPQSVASNWFVEFGVQAGTVTTSALGSATGYLEPIWFPTKVTISNLEVGVITGSGNCRLGIYAPDGTTINRPGALVASTGSTSTSGSNTVTSFALLSNAQVQGLYFKIVVCDNTTVTFSGPPTTSNWSNQLLGSSTATDVLNAGSNSHNMELSVPWTYANGALPSSISPSGSTCGTGAQACTYTVTKGASRVPIFGYQINSIP